MCWWRKSFFAGCLSGSVLPRLSSPDPGNYKSLTLLLHQVGLFKMPEGIFPDKVIP